MNELNELENKVNVLNTKKKGTTPIKITSITSFAVNAAVLGISLYNNYPTLTLISIIGIGVNVGGLSVAEGICDKANKKLNEINEKLDNIEKGLVSNNEDYNQLRKIRKSINRK